MSLSSRRVEIGIQGLLAIVSNLELNKNLKDSSQTFSLALQRPPTAMKEYMCVLVFSPAWTRAMDVQSGSFL